MIPSEMGKLELAAALVDRGGYDLCEVCPYCGESGGIRPRRCTECGRELLWWVNTGGHKVLCYTEVDHEEN